MDEKTGNEQTDVSNKNTQAKRAETGNGQDTKQKRLWSRIKIVAIGAAVFGMVVGSVVDRVVQNLLDKTGMFGPSLDQVVNAQTENFSAIKAKLTDLSAVNSPEVQEKLLKELNTLLTKQEQLTGRTHEELLDYSREVASLREQSLKTHGVAKGADFYLTPGQSITVGERDNVFSLLNVQKDGRSYINLSGKLKWLRIGDFIEAPAENGTYKIYNKGASSEDNNRIGFDLIKPANK